MEKDLPEQLELVHFLLGPFVGRRLAVQIRHGVGHWLLHGAHLVR